MSFYAPMVPDEIAVLIMDVHGYRKAFYKHCLHRFRPYDLTTSRLFEALEAEEEEQKQEFMQLIYTTLGTKRVAMTDFCFDTNTINPPHTEDAQRDEKNFFVVNSNMAKTILQAALQMEHETRQLLYERLCRAGAGHPTVGLVLKQLDAFVENHKQVLEEAIGRFYIQGPAYGADNTTRKQMAVVDY